MEQILGQKTPFLPWNMHIFVLQMGSNPMLEIKACL